MLTLYAAAVRAAVRGEMPTAARASMSAAAHTAVIRGAEEAVSLLMV
jgi:hypothetical protein